VIYEKCRTPLKMVKSPNQFNQVGDEQITRLIITKSGESSIEEKCRTGHGVTHVFIRTKYIRT